MLLHNLQELDDDLGAGSDHDLALSGLLGVVDALESIGKNGGSSHFDGWEELSREEWKLLIVKSRFSNPRI